jgi:ribose transport system substrate-binding protein
MKAIKSVALAVLALGILSTSGCDRHSDKEAYYLIATNVNLPYWQTSAAGFNKAVRHLQMNAASG